MGSTFSANRVLPINTEATYAKDQPSSTQSKNNKNEIADSVGAVPKVENTTNKTKGVSSGLGKVWNSVQRFRMSPLHTDSAASKDKTQDVGSDVNVKVQAAYNFKYRKFENIQHPLKKGISVLLVFPKTERQYKAFCSAVKMTDFRLSHFADSNSVMENCQDYTYDIIIIDTRQRKLLNAKELCRKLRTCHPQSIIVGVRKKAWIFSPWKTWSDKMSSFLAAGFNRDFIQNCSVDSCYDALLCFEKDVLTMCQLTFLKSFFLAVDNSPEAVEIINVNHEIQYINMSFEKLLGYSAEEAVGRFWYDLLASEKNPSDLNMKIKQHLDSVSPWEGFHYIKKKSGDHVGIYCRMYPFVEAGKVLHFIGIRKVLEQNVEHHVDSTATGEITVQETHRQSGVRQLSISYARERFLSSTYSPHAIGSNRNMVEIANYLTSMKSFPLPQGVQQLVDKTLDVIMQQGRNRSITKDVSKDEDHLIMELLDGLTTNTIPTNVEEDIRGRRRSTYYSVEKKAVQPRKPDGMSDSMSSLPLGNNLSQNALEIRKLLQDALRWDFNVLKIEALTNKRPLVYTGIKVFQAYEVFTLLSVDSSVFKNWLDVIEQNYNASNPYHNSSHAADVLQASASLMSRAKVKELLDQMDITSTLISAAIHDLDHPGKTNSYLINSQHKLAVLYNDVSVLENHHLALAFKLTFQDDKINIFQNMDKEDYRILRQQIIDMVLATDMTRHFEYVKCFDEVVQRLTFETTSMAPEVKIYPMEVRTAVKRMLIKCSDVSNPTRPLESCKVWATRIAEEYCRQTDDEKAKGLPVVMPVFDRTKCNLPKTQVTFINFFVIKMFDSWNEFCPVPDLVENLESNFEFWQQQEASVTERVVNLGTSSPS